MSLTLALFAAVGAWAQTPDAAPQLDVATTGGTQFLESAALDGLGNVTLLWTQFLFDQTAARGRRFSSADVPLGSDIKFDPPDSQSREVVANERGDTITIWNRRLPGGRTEGVLRRVSPVLPPLTLRMDHGLTDVAIDQAGNFVVVWGGVMGQRYNADGSKRGPEFNAATNTRGSLFATGVAMNHRTGEFVVIWVATNRGGANEGIFGQRFGFTTGRQGSEFQVAATDLGFRLVVDVGRAEDGSFAVVWSRRRPDELVTDFYGRHYDASGGEFLCDTAHNGGAAETVIAFSVPGGIPLFGDLDGDGRDDPCLFRGGAFACDTAHDGGAAEKTITVTSPGRPLIGNVDGL